MKLNIETTDAAATKKVLQRVLSNIEQDEIDNALDDGFWECKYSGAINDEKSVNIKEISFEED